MHVTCLLRGRYMPVTWPLHEWIPLQVAVNDMRRVRSASVAQAPCTRSLRAGMQPLPRLPIEVVQRAYLSASRRFILLGLDGTLIQQVAVTRRLRG